MMFRVNINFEDLLKPWLLFLEPPNYSNWFKNISNHLLDIAWSSPELGTRKFGKDACRQKHRDWFHQFLDILHMESTNWKHEMETSVLSNSIKGIHIRKNNEMDVLVFLNSSRASEILKTWNTHFSIFNSAQGLYMFKNMKCEFQ